MSVGFARAVEAGLRYNSVPVSFQPGWETRGNGQVFPGGKPQGLLVHHTGSGYGAGLTILIGGRPDLDPPLCNACLYPDGRVHIIAAHVANHAGASGGRSMGPLPTTTLFNRVVWGVEVMFPGITPWTDAQYRSARVLGGVISGILRHPNPEYVRAHAECSRSGKWDPGSGRGSGATFDMNRFRREIWDALRHTPPPEDDMAGLTDEEHRWLQEIHTKETIQYPSRSQYAGHSPGVDDQFGYTMDAAGRGDDVLIELRQMVAALPGVIRREVAAALEAQPPGPPAGPRG